MTRLLCARARCARDDRPAQRLGGDEAALVGREAPLALTSASARRAEDRRRGRGAPRALAPRPVALGRRRLRASPASATIARAQRVVADLGPPRIGPGLRRRRRPRLRARREELAEQARLAHAGSPTMRAADERAVDARCGGRSSHARSSSRADERERAGAAGWRARVRGASRGVGRACGAAAGALRRTRDARAALAAELLPARDRARRTTGR